MLEPKTFQSYHMDIISTWIYLDSPEESSEYPQVGKGSHLPEFQQVYWRCVAVFFDIIFNPPTRFTPPLFMLENPSNMLGKRYPF